MKYHLEQLDEDRFQQLCQALVTRAEPQAQCFPVSQPDGGRDAMVLRNSKDASLRNMVIYQVKFVRKPFSIADPHDWLVKTLKKEASKVRKLIPRGAVQFYLLTNVPGTGHFENGSLDRTQQILDAEIDVPAMCWWRDDIERRLDDAWDIKWSYPEIMTSSDILRLMVENGINEHRERRSSAIRAFVQEQYNLDSEVKFKQVDLQNGLFDLFIDVPLMEKPLRHEFWERRVFYGTHRGSHLERDQQPGTASTLLLGGDKDHLQQLVLEGGPGQGKSTVVQFVAQVYRLGLLQKQDVIDSLPVELRPSGAKLPIKADLTDLSLWLGKGNPFDSLGEDDPPVAWERSLEGFLAALIRYQSGGASFSVDDLHAVCRISSVLLVLDGLDEVADIGKRSELVKVLQSGIDRLRSNCAALQVIVTSRPAAFANSPGLPEKNYAHLSLATLGMPQVDAYTTQWLRAKKLYGSEGATIRRILRRQMDQPHLRELARNPMQLTILLSLIHTRGSSLPDKRTALYDNYVGLFFDREAEKTSVVRENRETLLEIHRFLAWQMHGEIEKGKPSERISEDRLKSLIRQYLIREERNPDLVDHLFGGVVERLFFLVANLQGAFEFEVQPIREYFAARHLYETAPDSPPGEERGGAKPDRFDVIAPNFYWLNCSRFYAGCYSKGALPSLARSLRDLADKGDYRFISHPRVLAGMLLSDHVFSQDRRALREAIQVALGGVWMRQLQGNHLLYRRADQEIFTLPTGAGREELIDECFQSLVKATARDHQADIASVLSANATVEELFERWMTYAQSFEGKELELWLDAGLHLGVLSIITHDQLAGVWSRVHDQRVAARTIFRAGRTDFLESDPARFQIALEGIVNGEIRSSINRRSQSLLVGLAQLLDPSAYLQTSFRERSYLKRDEKRAAGGVIEDQTSPVFDSERHAEAKEIISLADKMLLSVDELEWATSLRPWSALVEAIRIEYGDVWQAVTLAHFASAISSSTERGSGFSELSDGFQPLCERFRYARFRSGAANYWRKQFASATDDLEVASVALSFFTWSTDKCLAEVLDVAGQALDSLSEEFWKRLARSFGECRSLIANFRGTKLPRSQKPSDFTFSSPRAAILVSERFSSNARTDLYEQFLKSYKGSDSQVLDFCQSQAISLAMREPSYWRQALKVVEKGYRHGLVLGPLPFAMELREFRRYQSMENMPLEIARDVCAFPQRYPRILLSLAEDRCRSETQRAIVPVMDTARKERWSV